MRKSENCTTKRSCSGEYFGRGLQFPLFFFCISEIEKIVVDLSENSKLVCLRYFPAIACQDTDTLHPFLIENEWHIIYINIIKSHTFIKHAQK